MPGKAVPRLLVMCPKRGQLTVHSWTDLGLHLYTLNGRHLASEEGTEKLHALTVSPDGSFLLSGGAKGVLSIRHAHSLQVGVRLMRADVGTALCKHAATS